MKLKEIILSAWPEVLSGMEETEAVFLAHGSSREVYKINDDFVIKVANNPAGVAQNREEATNSIIGSLGAKVYAYDNPGFQWVVMEYATVATNISFMNYVGVRPFDLLRVVDGDKGFEIESEFINKIREYISRKGNRRSFHDSLKPESWGFVERDGKQELVLIDYGLNDEILKKFFGPKSYDPYERARRRKEVLKAKRKNGKSA